MMTRIFQTLEGEYRRNEAVLIRLPDDIVGILKTDADQKNHYFEVVSRTEAHAIFISLLRKLVGYSAINAQRALQCVGGGWNTSEGIISAWDMPALCRIAVRTKRQLYPAQPIISVGITDVDISLAKLDAEVAACMSGCHYGYVVQRLAGSSYFFGHKHVIMWERWAHRTIDLMEARFKESMNAPT